MTNMITIPRSELKEAYVALQYWKDVCPQWWEERDEKIKETLRARLSAPEPEKSLSQKLADAGYTKRDDRLECDECGKKFTRQMLPIHDCQPEPEPVAWRFYYKNMWSYVDNISDLSRHKFEPLYTAPPQREWQGLTDEEVDALHYYVGGKWSTTKLVRHVEAKLREKNS